jgi:hypothetical protein
MARTATLPKIPTEPIENLFSLEQCPICGNDQLDYQRSLQQTKTREWDWKVRCRPCNTNLTYYLVKFPID